jgi:ABC-type dipeptide/oligopeptide/nickel transport system permease subunit
MAETAALGFRAAPIAGAWRAWPPARAVSHLAYGAIGFRAGATHLLGIDPGDVDLYHRFAAPSGAHLLGTDELGRDVLMRLLYGGRVSLAAGLTAAVIAAVIGTAVGLPAGYFGGRLDAALMRVTDGMIALPLLPLLVVLAAVDLAKLGLPPAAVQSESADFYRIVAIIALVGWTTVARLVRGAALSLRGDDVCPRRRGGGGGRLAHHDAAYPAQRRLAGDRRHGRSPSAT